MKALPTKAQAVVLLNVLAAAPRFRWSLDAFGECWAAGWMSHERTRGQVTRHLTPAGGDDLARWLLRDFSGPVVVVPEQPIMFADEARALLMIVTTSHVVASNDVLEILLRCGWIRVIRGKLAATDEGRDALAAHLLRGWRP